MAAIQSGVPWTSGVDDNTTELAARNTAAEESMGGLTPEELEALASDDELAAAIADIDVSTQVDAAITALDLPATYAPRSQVGVHLAFGDSAGDETTTSATAVPLTGLTWPSVPAAVDDILEIEFTANWYVGAAGNIFVRFDLGGTDGREHMLDCASTRPGVHVIKEYRQVTSGMISGGEVAITADWWRGSTSVSANMENDTTRTVPVLAVTNRGAPLV